MQFGVDAAAVATSSELVLITFAAAISTASARRCPTWQLVERTGEARAAAASRLPGKRPSLLSCCQLAIENLTDPLSK